MPYCAQADLEQRYGTDEVRRVSDRSRPPRGAADAAVVSSAIAQADAEVDGYLGVVVALPIADVPELVKLISCTIARYRLHEDQATDRIRMDYEDAVRMLRDIASGRLVLFAAGAEVATSAVVVKSSPVVFTDAVLATI